MHPAFKKQTCNRHATGMQQACNRHATGMQQACTGMQQACNRRAHNGLLLSLLRAWCGLSCRVSFSSENSLRPFAMRTFEASAAIGSLYASTSFGMMPIMSLVSPLTPVTIGLACSMNSHTEPTPHSRTCVHFCEHIKGACKHACARVYVQLRRCRITSIFA